MINIYGCDTERLKRVWLRRIFAAYTILFLLGIGFYIGSRIDDLWRNPAATVVQVAIHAAGAFLVGMVFGLLGVMCAITTFLINDSLQSRP